MLKSIIEKEVKSFMMEFWGRKETDVFSKLKALDAKEADFEEYVELLSQFPKVGQGSSRIVYAIDDDLVIKLEKPTGEPQNEYESDPALQSLFGDFVPKVFDSSIDYMWIISERVTPVKTRSQEIQWLKKAGLGEIIDRGLEMHDISAFLEDFHKIYDDIRDELGEEALGKVNIEKIFNAAKRSSMGSSRDAKNKDWNFSFEDLKRWAENPIIGLISRARKDNEISAGDVGLGNIGFASDGRPVILDIGLSKYMPQDY